MTVLVQHLSQPRFESYLRATGYRREYAAQLYLWDRELSAAFFVDIALLEVALRNSLDRALVQRYGKAWHEQSRTLFNDRVYRDFEKIWERLKLGTAGDSEQARGRLIAGATFGTWTNMLDAGTQPVFRGPSTGLLSLIDHEIIWDRATLLMAFPGSRKIMAREQPGKPLNRGWVHAQVKLVHQLRNRVAHHEPLINGFPLNGQKDRFGNPIRRTAREAFEDCLRLAQMIDRALAVSLKDQSRVPEMLAKDPRLMMPPRYGIKTSGKRPKYVPRSVRLRGVPF